MSDAARVGIRMDRETENARLRLPLGRSVTMQPACIQPQHGIRSMTPRADASPPPTQQRLPARPSARRQPERPPLPAPPRSAGLGITAYRREARCRHRIPARRERPYFLGK